MSNETSENTETNSKKVDLSPNKEIYRSAAVDVSPIDAVEELVDNALDNWARVSQRVDTIKVDITAEDGLTKVRDDTGGLEEENIRLLFALGETFQEEVAGSIGAYGIGAKKALVRLGEERIVKSRARDGETGLGFRVDEDWLDSAEWEVELEEFPDLDSGVTEIETHSSDTVWDDERVERLKETLRNTYARFLERSTVEGSLNITVNGDELEAPDDIPWTFSPYDGLHPRRFGSIEIYPKGISAPVTMDVTVGLMRNADSATSGTDFYLQDRLVTKHEKEEVGGYGSVADDRIGNFTSHNNRLRVVVELHTDGDSADLPWDAQKTTIDPYHPVSRAMYDWLRRIVRPYFKADTGSVPKAFVEPYTPDHEYAANGGNIEVLDYSGRSKVNDKPDKSVPTIKEVRKTAENHAERGIVVTDKYSPAQQVAYEAHIQNQFKEEEEVDLRHLTTEELGDEGDDVEAVDEVSFSDFVAGVNGAGATKEEALREAGYESIEAIRVATVDELTAVDGIGTSLAEKLIEAAGGSIQDEDGGDEVEDRDAETEGDADASATDNGTDVTTDSTTSQSQQTVNGTTEPGRVRIPLEMSEEEFEQLRERLDLDEDADVEDIGEDLKARLLAMFAPAQ